MEGYPFAEGVKSSFGAESDNNRDSTATKRDQQVGPRGPPIALEAVLVNEADPDS
jgi:hypothetical protein